MSGYLVNDQSEIVAGETQEDVLRNRIAALEKEKEILQENIRKQPIQSTNVIERQHPAKDRISKRKETTCKKIACAFFFASFLVLCIAIYFSVDVLIKPYKPQISSFLENTAYEYLTKYSKETMEFRTRINGYDKVPKLRKISTPEDLLKLFEDKHGGMIKKMLDKIRDGETCVSSYQVIKDMTEEDEIPDFIILDNKAEVSEKWYKNLAIYTSNVTRRLGLISDDLFDAIEASYGRRRRHVQEFLIIFNIKIEKVGSSTEKLTQKLPAFDPATQKINSTPGSTKITLFNFITASGDIGIPYDDERLFRFEHMPSLGFSMDHAWCIQTHHTNTRLIYDKQKQK